MDVIEDDNAWVFALADAIGERMSRGELPPQDENGFYLIDQARRLEVTW